jgi:hypothetical protein
MSGSISNRFSGRGPSIPGIPRSPRLPASPNYDSSSGSFSRYNSDISSSV